MIRKIGYLLLGIPLLILGLLWIATLPMNWIIVGVLTEGRNMEYIFIIPTLIERWTDGVFDGCKWRW